MTHIAKRFEALTAIHDASLTIRPGEIHALVGENGAGKTTLMNILYGLLPRDGGEI
ncbi:MAG TPA: ATP-binding cassette domain-containing protein, partial [Roseiarcus sp.]|nr:ATP-binding cassette domain-containing protein [Roseiarcus sp.]